MKLTRDIDPDHRYINEYVPLPNGMIAHRYGILTTSFVSYEVYEPSQMLGKHSSITTIDGKWYGSITTRPLPENMTAFNKFWQALEEKLWRMESEPFSDLRYLMKSFQENGIHRIETATQEAKKAIHNELFRK